MSTFQFDEFSSHQEALRKSNLPVQLHQDKAIVIAGPTGVGKTTMSLHLAKLLNGEIISADSMQVYRGMNIGTAKATNQQQKEIAHHLIDIRDLNQNFNVVDYFEEVKKALKSIISRKKIPLIVGGTGFYINALIYGPPIGPPSDQKLRKQIEKEIEIHGPEPLYDRIRKLDPIYSENITPRDKHKIVRALEIMMISGKKVSDFQPSKHSKGLNVDFHCWFLTMNRSRLYKRIEARCDEMLEEGLLQEVEDLLSKGLKENSTACQAIGYKQIIEYLAGSRSQDEYLDMVQRFKSISKRYAKKQYTWFRRKEEFRWIDLDKYSFHQAIQLILRDFDAC